MKRLVIGAVLGLLIYPAGSSARGRREVMVAPTQAELRATQFIEQQTRRGLIRWTPKSEVMSLKLLCLDGRWIAEQCGDDVPSMLGGSAGEALRELVAFVRSVPETRRQATIEAILKVMPRIVTTVQGVTPICVHSDHHVHGSGKKSGCGYINALWTMPELFGEEVPQIVEAFVGQADEHRAPVDDRTVLHGQHEELGLLVVHSTNGKVPRIVPQVDGRQYFVYVPDAEQLLRAELSAHLLPLLVECTGETMDQTVFSQELEQVTDEHVNHALELLAQGKPVIDVTLDEEDGVVSATER